MTKYFQCQLWNVSHSINKIYSISIIIKFQNILPVLILKKKKSFYNFDPIGLPLFLFFFLRKVFLFISICQKDYMFLLFQLSVRKIHKFFSSWLRKLIEAVFLTMFVTYCNMYNRVIYCFVDCNSLWHDNRGIYCLVDYNSFVIHFRLIY